MAYRMAPSMINEAGVWKGSHARRCNESKKEEKATVEGVQRYALNLFRFYCDGGDVLA